MCQGCQESACCTSENHHHPWWHTTVGLPPKCQRKDAAANLLLLIRQLETAAEVALGAICGWKYPPNRTAHPGVRTRVNIKLVHSLHSADGACAEETICAEGMDKLFYGLPDLFILGGVVTIFESVQFLGNLSLPQDHLGAGRASTHCGLTVKTWTALQELGK